MVDDLALCGQVSNDLALAVDRTISPSRALLDHLEVCDACRADLYRYRRLLQMLADLRSESELLPDGVIADIVSTISRAAEHRALRDLLRRHRRGYVVGLFCVAAVVSTVLAFARGRSHRADAATPA